MPGIRVNDIEMFYHIRGEGPPLVLIQGIGVNLTYWSPVFEALGASHRIITADNRGAGRSDAPPGPYTVPQMANDLLGLLDALNVPQADFVGHSMGAYIGMHIASHHPQRVRRLILYSTSTTFHWPAARFLEGIERLWAEYPDIASGTLTRLFLPWNLSPKMLADSAQIDMLVKLADTNMYKMSREAFSAQLDACRVFNGEVLLPRITAPVHVISGAADLIAPPDLQKALAEKLNASLSVSTSGHSTHLEEPAWFAEHVLRFLDN